LPIARPFKLLVYYVPYEIFVEEGQQVGVKPIKVFHIALNKNSKIEDLKKITA